MEGLGLRDDWRAVINSLRNIADIYDRVNRVISFNTDMRFRVEALTGCLRDGDRVLDLGCGTGVFGRVALSLRPGLGDVVMADFLAEMLERVGEDGRTHRVQGVFEHLPFRDSCFDLVMMGFSLRDSLRLEEAVEEVNRVSRADGGRFTVVDLGKPDSRVCSTIVGLYWRVFAPLLAALYLGRRGLEVAKIYPTYRRHPRTSRLKSLISRYFGSVTVSERMLGGVVIVRALNPLRR